MSMNYLLFLYFNIRTLFTVSKSNVKKKPKSFLIDLGFLVEFICYNFLYHPKSGCVFGSLLYVKPHTVSLHNEFAVIVSALEA